MSSQLIAQRLAGRGDVCRLECWKLQRGMREMGRVWGGGQSFPRGQYAQLPAVTNDRGISSYIASYTCVPHANDRTIEKTRCARLSHCRRYTFTR